MRWNWTILTFFYLIKSVELSSAQRPWKSCIDSSGIAHIFKAEEKHIWHASKILYMPDQACRPTKLTVYVKSVIIRPRMLCITVSQLGWHTFVCKFKLVHKCIFPIIVSDNAVERKSERARATNLSAYYDLSPWYYLLLHS